MTALTNRKQSLLDVLTICLLTLVISALLILACKASPVEAASLFVKGIFGTKASFAEIFVKACPLILTGLGCAVAFRTGFFNIGAEGQFYVGAISATLVALGLPQVPGVVRIVLCMVVAFVCGGIWALIAAVFKTRFNISEIIVTIMLNYIVINFLGYAVRSFLMDPAGNVPQSAKIDQAAQLPNLITSTRFHAGIVLAFVLAAVVWFLMEKTTVGYELKAVGLNQRAAACNGVPVVRSIIFSAFLSGGLAAIAGSIEVLAIQKKLMEGISGDCGYTAVLIALVAFNRPLGVVAVAILYAAMEVGASSMQRQLGVSSAIVTIIISVVVVLILIHELLRWYNLRKKG